jgi:CBS domain-containing protein
MAEPTVGQIMTRKVIVAHVSETLESVVSKMRMNNISGCPVVDTSDHLVGVVSEVDLARVLSLGRGVGSLAGFLEALLSSASNETLDPLQVLLHRFRHLRVGSCMSSPAIAVGPEETLGAAAAMMRSHRINRLPVVDRDRIVGILTRTDVLRAVGLGGTLPSSPSSHVPVAVVGR